MLIIAGILVGLPAMEAVAWASHKWIMHGPLWILHRSHHGERRNGLEPNDAFGIFFSGVSILFIRRGVHGHPFLLGLGLGMTLYGLAYLLIHDGLAHGRFGARSLTKLAYLRRLVRAHRIHHSRDAADGTRNFGFLWAPRRETVKP